MLRVNHPEWRNVVFFLTGLIIVVADQLSKAWIRTNLPDGQSLFDIGFLRVTRIQNTGAAFGLFQDQSFALTIIALISIVALLAYSLLVSHRFPWLDGILGRSALGFFLGGTAGNLIDRLRFGFVTDFIDFSFWPAFNIADSAVTIGVILVFYSVLRLSKVTKHGDRQDI